MSHLSDENIAVDTVALPASAAPQSGVLGVPSAGELKEKSVRGGAARVAGQGIGMALQIGTTVILARLLSPSDYGLQAMVLTLINLFSLFKDAGLSVATVQRETLTNEQISTLFWINIALGFVLTLLTAAAAPFVADFYKDPRLVWLTVASSSVFFFNSLSVQHSALMDRAMRFTTSVKIDILSSVIGATVAVGMAAMGFGYWSLICQNISLPIVGTIATWIAMPWMPGRPKWTPELRAMVRFGQTVTFNTIVVYIAYNTEKILLGRYWGAGALGLYSRAYQLATLPVQQLINAMHGVAFAALSRMQGDYPRLLRAFLKSQSIVVAMTIPVVLASALFPREIVLAVLGHKWIDAAPLFRLLAPTVLVFALVNPFSWFLRATGRVGRSLKTSFLLCPVVILGILAGLRHGPNGVAFGYSSAMVLLFVPLVWWAIYRTGITWGNYWDSVKRPLIAGVIAGAGGWLVQFFFNGVLAPVPLLLLELGVSGTIYAAILLFAMAQMSFYADLFKQFQVPAKT